MIGWNAKVAIAQRDDGDGSSRTRHRGTLSCAVGLGVLEDDLRFALSACRMEFSLSQVIEVTASIDEDMTTSVPKDG